VILIIFEMCKLGSTQEYHSSKTALMLNDVLPNISFLIEATGNANKAISSRLYDCFDRLIQTKRTNDCPLSIDQYQDTQVLCNVSQVRDVLCVCVSVCFDES
jgi:hypothetical protein